MQSAELTLLKLLSGGAIMPIIAFISLFIIGAICFACGIFMIVLIDKLTGGNAKTENNYIDKQGLFNKIKNSKK